MATIRRRNGRYQAQVRKQHRPPVSRTFKRLSDARRWVTSVEYEMEQGAFQHSPTPAFQTIGDLINYYQTIINPADDPRHTITSRLGTLKQHLGPIHLTQLRGSDLARYRDERLKTIKASTLARELSLLRCVFRVAREEWDVEIKDCPLDRFRVADARPARERRLEPGEEARLLRACSQARTPWLRPAVELALETAMRRGELLNARYEHLQKGLLSIPITKTGIPRTIPLTPRALTVIRALPRSISGYFLPTSANALRLSWERAKRRAMLEDLHFHDLRHEAISRFFEMGLSIPEVALISGHKDYRMLARYTHLRAEDLVERLG